LNTPANFHEQSYQLHESENKLENQTLTELQKAWFRDDTVAYWRMMRPFIYLSHFIQNLKGSKWLTLGDGRFGLDSIALKRVEPSLNVIPTDISTDQLEYARRENLINSYAKVNAENIDFGNDSFDYVLCKESYHHFPRPFLALYEMLRIAKKAVILIEPNDKKDTQWPREIVLQFKHFIKRIAGRKILPLDTWNFEVVGNYIYSVSKRDMEKFALGLNLPGLAFRYYNDYYEKGVEFAPAPRSPLFKKVNKKIKVANLTCKWGFSVYTSIMIIIFKQPPDTNDIQLLQDGGFTFVDLPENPYLKKAQ
jgi:ubiquinone/menaquinone biosynthesis C-methylase UbiE